MSTRQRTRIESLGVTLPERRVTTAEVLRGCRVKTDFPMENWTGITAHRRAGDGEFAVDLAERALRICLARSRYAASDIDLVISCAISHVDRPMRITYEPGNAARLAARVGLDNALAFDITNACAGMFTGAVLASDFLATGRARRALVVSGEYITHLTDTAQRELKSGNFLDPALPCLTLGDAGAAIVLDRVELEAGKEVGFEVNDLVTLSRYCDLCIACPVPGGGGLMKTDAQRQNAVGTREGLRHLKGVMTKLGCRPRDFDHLISHQVSRATLTGAVRLVNKAFGAEELHAGNVIVNLAERGNTATTSHFVALWDACREGRIKTGERVFFTTAASGLVVGGAAYTLDDLPSRLRADAFGKQDAAPTAAAASWAARGSDLPSIQFAAIAITSAPRESDSFGLAASAGESALKRAGVPRKDYSHLIFYGLYRTDWVGEPAIAAFVARDLRMNEAFDPEHATLALDLQCGAGFLCACEVARQLIAVEPGRHVLLSSSELDPNRAAHNGVDLGIEPSGAAVAVHAAADSSQGLGSLVVRRLPGEVECMWSETFMGDVAVQTRGGLDVAVPHFLAALPSVVAEVLALEGVTLDAVDALIVGEPLPELGLRIAQKLGIPTSRLWQTQRWADRATCALPYAIRAALDAEFVGRGRLGLLVEVGSGLTVACATYRF